jgi:AcrR family transcriptional regulator
MKARDGTATSGAQVRGRPRDAAAHAAILSAALDLLVAEGFRALNLDRVADVAGVGKMTIYRRWPNKAAVVMDALLSLIGPESQFPRADTAVASIRLQMRLQGRLFRGPYGGVIKALLGEAQFDVQLAEAFRERWINPRRLMTRGVLETAIHEGSLRSDIDIETTIDMLYGPLYYRLQIGTGPVSEAFIDRVYEQALRGVRSRSG